MRKKSREEEPPEEEESKDKESKNETLMSNYLAVNYKMRNFLCVNLQKEEKQAFCERLWDEVKWETRENIDNLTKTLEKGKSVTSYTKILNFDIQNVLHDGVLHRLVMDENMKYLLVEVIERKL